jgi:expansin (peptidoglycan-binding protein)
MELGGAMNTRWFLGLAAAIIVTGCGNNGTSSGGHGGANASTSTTGMPIACSAEPMHSGDGTYYNADGTGNCSFDASTDLMVGAMNHTDYAGSAVCGECVAITGPSGSVNIRIVDQCPGCNPGDIDLSPQAFQKISPLAAGRVHITWKVVSCGYQSPIEYHFKEGSNAYWSAVQIRNSQNAILKLEAKKNGAYETLMRADYNFFLDASGLGPGPYSFRVTDVYGNVLEDPSIPFAAATTVPGAAQFPPCP